jgi:glutamate synthase domain-containing protein 2
VKVGARAPYYDVALAVKAGADVVVLDGMQGGTAATQDVFIEHVGMPILAASAGGAGAAGPRHAPQGAADRLGRHPQRRRRGQGAGAGRRCGGHRHGGAGRAGRQRSALEAEYQKLGTTAGAYDDWHEGKDPAGITTQDPELASARSGAGGRRLANYLKVMTLEAQTIARACGKSHLHNLEPEDLWR